MDAQPATSELWDEVAYFMNIANTIRDTYDKALTSTQQVYAKSQFEIAYYNMLASFSPQFGQFASRYLSNHPLLSVKE
jgi:ferritin-like metal-binding protein YciE